MTIQLHPNLAKFAENGVMTPRAIRRFFIDLGMRRQKPGTGSSHEFMLRRTADIQWPDLRQILQNFQWVIVGGVATRAFMPERMTKDLDILVHQRDSNAVLQALEDAGYKRVKELGIVSGYLMRSHNGTDVDVLFGDQEWVNEALSRPTFDPANYPVLDLPYLVLMKLESGRASDYGDVTKMLGWNADELIERVRDAIARYSPEDSGDLESMIMLGRLERQLPDGGEK